MLQMLDNAGTIVFVSHSMNNVEEFCNRTAWLDHGVVQAIDDSSDVVQLYRDSL
jgi:ABC-type polysaccharide/polyol phosphate transport system ATPase subunit